MATGVLIVGESGSGKSHSLKTLDPKTTYIINADRKILPFKGWKQLYNTKNKNYFQTSVIDNVIGTLNGISEKRPDIKVVVIDTLNGIMLDKEMTDRKTKGFEKWNDLAGYVYEIIAGIGDLREDLIVIVTGHIEKDDATKTQRLLTNGRKLEKIKLESKFTIVLFTGRNDQNEYIFYTQSDGTTTAKSPEGMFESLEIPNDCSLVVKAIQDYEL